MKHQTSGHKKSDPVSRTAFKIDLQRTLDKARFLESRVSTIFIDGLNPLR
jgi:hypothetical protein